jgi:hypothetical protein
VGDPQRVQRAECFGQLGADRGRVALGQRAALESGLERLALDQLHDDEVHPAVLGVLVHHADVRVVDARRGHRFAQELAASLGVRERALGEELERHFALQPLVARAVDHAHAAGAEPFEDLVMGEPGADHADVPVRW